MANNTILNVGAGGDVIRDIDRLGVKTQVAQIDIGGTAGEVLVVAGQQVMAASLPVVIASNQTAVPTAISQATAGVTNGVQITALSYPQSVSNNSTVQLAAGATFTGTIEAVLSVQAAQVEVVCDQPYTVFIDQFIDAAGTKLSATYSFTRLASVPINENVTLPGNYMRIRVQNTGAAATTTFQLDTTFGIMNTMPNTLSNNGNLKVVSLENGVVSVVNSSTTNLALSAVFTGTAEDVSEYSMIMVGVMSSHASATDGLSIQQSSDGTNWDFTDAFTISASAGKAFSFAVQQKFFRIVYTNGATATTFFRLQILYSRIIKKSSSVRPQDARPNDNDFDETVGYLMGFNGTSWDRMRSTIANGLAVDVTRLPAITKSTQGTTGVSTQDLKDAGRVNIAITSYQAAGIITTEALFAATAFSLSRDGAAATTGAQFTVTAGKRLRIQAIECSIKNTAALAGTSKLVLRYAGAGGVISTTSPILAIWDLGSNNAVANNYIGPAILSLPDGLELIAASTFGFTSLCSAATMLHTVTVTGYEY